MSLLGTNLFTCIACFLFLKFYILQKGFKGNFWPDSIGISSTIGKP
jgi:hypothetical protein